MERKNLTLGQQTVGLKFNPSGLTEVDKVKQQFADPIDAVYAKRETTKYQSDMICIDHALSALLSAQMAMVKVTTLPA